MPNPHLQGWFAASVPKAGSRAAENEDATVADAKRVRFAIADGATEGWQSGGWARHLAKAYVDQPPGPPDFTNWLDAARTAWAPPTPKAERWYTEEKAEQGSFATLLGLEFRLATDPPGLVWKAVAVGDSCLFVIRNEKLEVAFPLTDAAAFGNEPPLVPSATDRECPEPDWLAGWSEPGDLFLMATDAVARFILKAGEAAIGSHPIVKIALQSVASGTAAPTVELLESLKAKLNDDASIVAVRVAEDRRSTR